MICIDCMEQEATSGDRCRDCDLEHIFATWPTCSGCGARLYNDDAAALGIVTLHGDGCTESAP